MFAFVLYDSGRDEFFVARDPVSISKLSSNYVMLKRYKSHISKVGVIPLYIGYGGDGTTWFSSELKGLQKHCDHIEVTSSQHSVAVQNRDAFVKSLENLQVFPPGHYMFGSSLSKGPVPEPIRLFVKSPKIPIQAQSPIFKLCRSVPSFHQVLYREVDHRRGLHPNRARRPHGVEDQVRGVCQAPSIG